MVSIAQAPCSSECPTYMGCALQAFLAQKLSCSALVRAYVQVWPLRLHRSNSVCCATDAQLVRASCWGCCVPKRAVQAALHQLPRPAVQSRLGT